MYAIFETIEEYNAKNAQVNEALLYPNPTSSSYAEPLPRVSSDGRFVMQVLPFAEQYFTGCVIVDNVEFSEVEE